VNFFFGIKTSDLNCDITIPRFQNHGKVDLENIVFQAKIYLNKWVIQKAQYKENKNFFFINNNCIDNEIIFFLAKEKEILKYNKTDYQNILDLNKFTDTQPAFRANLKIFNKFGGFSSYQSEYPYSMIEKQGNILSPLSSLGNSTASENKLFIRNIYVKPIKKKFDIYFLDIKKKKILFKKEILTNTTNEIKVEKKYINPDIFLYTNDYIGIPLFVSLKDHHISFEHTHPPHEYIISEDKFKTVAQLKREIHDIINKKNR